MNFKAANILLAFGALTLVGCSDGIDGVTTIINVPVENEVTSDGFPDGVWTIQSTGSGLFNDSIMSISNNGRLVEFSQWVNDDSILSDFFVNECFLSPVQGNVNSAGVLSGDLPALLETITTLQLDRIEYNGSVDEDGEIVVQFFGSGSTVTSELEAIYTAAIGSEVASTILSNTCDDGNVGMFKIVTSNTQVEIPAPLYAQITTNGVTVLRPDQFDFNTSCSAISANASVDGTRLTLGDVAYRLDGDFGSSTTGALFLSGQRITSEAVPAVDAVTVIDDPLTTADESLLSTPAVGAIAEVTSTAGAIDLERQTLSEVSNILSIPSCPSSEIASIDVLMLTPDQFGTATESAADLRYELVVNGVRTSSVDSPTTPTINTVGGQVMGLLLDPSTSYDVVIEVYASGVILAQRDLGILSGGAAPFTELPANVVITPGEVDIVIGENSYKIIETNVFNVVNGSGYDVDFDADLDGLRNHEEIELGTNPLQIETNVVVNP